MSMLVRPLTAADLPAAARINRAAFSQFFGIPDPAKFRVGADVIGPRWRLWPEAGLALDIDGALAAVGLMTRWGSVCVLGPVTVAPEHWSKGLARALMPKLLDLVERGGFAFTALFTHPQSPKHIRLYESYGFRMQRITAVMAKPVSAGRTPAKEFSRVAATERPFVLEAIRALTEGIFPGLDVTAEVADMARHGLGQTLLLESEGDGQGRLDGVALCHAGTGSEASEGQVLVKFAAARGGDGADARFERLLAACEAYAASRGAAQIVAGTNIGRAEAYALLQQAGFRTTMNGIAMTRPGLDGYNRPGVYAIDDWR
jgi:GNAT superfamily N-acetyltransferase